MCFIKHFILVLCKFHDDLTTISLLNIFLINVDILTFYLKVIKYKLYKLLEEILLNLKYTI
jgi:hypothetical protein